MASGIVFVVLVFLYSVACPWNFFGKRDPIGAEAGYGRVADRAQAELQKTGATWIATTDYRTYAMMRWYFNGRVPVIQINERGRFMGFRDPGMNAIAGHAGLYVAREPDEANPVWAATSAVRVPLEQVDRVWRGTVMDRYALQKLTNWTPQLSPPPDFAAVPLAGAGRRSPATGAGWFSDSTSQTADPISITLASSFETPRQSAAPQDEVLLDPHGEEAPLRRLEP